MTYTQWCAAKGLDPLDLRTVEFLYSQYRTYRMCSHGYLWLNIDQCTKCTENIRLLKKQEQI